MIRVSLRLLFAAMAIFALTAMTPAQAPLPPGPPILPVPDLLPGTPIPPVMPALPVMKALTVREFACTDFKAGTYTVFLIHPCSQRPVKVCFSLPVCPRRVRVTSAGLDFRWGVLLCKRVSIRFMADGTVRVL